MAVKSMLFRDPFPNPKGWDRLMNGLNQSFHSPWGWGNEMATEEIQFYQDLLLV